MVATNPGQTFYNLIAGEPGNTEALSVSIDVPYPYVTVGGMPLHVYPGDVDIDTENNCFLPEDALWATDVMISLEDWIAGSSDSRVSCSTPANQGTDWCGPDVQPAGTCTVTVEIPADVVDAAGGQVYVNLHLDYGLKAPHVDANPCGDELADRYDVSSSLSDWMSADAWLDTVCNNGCEDQQPETCTTCDTPDLRVKDCQDYEFCHIANGDGPLCDSVQNLNVFKGIAGAFGRVFSSSTGDGHEDLILTLARSGRPNAILQTSTTDEDGSYALIYKHKGKPTMYIVDLYDQSGNDVLSTITVELQGNGWTNIDFDSDDNPCNIESSFCECNGWCAAAEYGSGRLSGGGGGGGTEPSINCSDYNGDPDGCALAGCRYNTKKETCR
jgi:hypothetical protein